MLMHALNYAKRILANAHTEYVDVLLLDVYIFVLSITFFCCFFFLFPPNASIREHVEASFTKAVFAHFLKSNIHFV